MSESADPLIGSVLGGRYEIVGRVNRGGTAVVYRARDLRLGRTVAVKVIHEDLSDDPDYVKRFDREARAAAILSHPNIVAVFDQGHEAHRSYIVMEYIRGQSLRQIISASAPLPPALALTYFEAVAKALAAAHEAGIIHRDIKPENVLITQDGLVKVTDFGLAKNLTGQSSTATSGVLMGTISYMPPEIPQTGVAGMSSDVYSAGILLYEMLTGQKPHRGDDVTEVIYKHVNVDVPPPSQALGDAAASIPDYLDALVMTCTRRDPSERPVDGRALEKAISKVRKALDKGILHDPQLSRDICPPDSEETPIAEDITEVVPAAAPSRGSRTESIEKTPVHASPSSATPLARAMDKARAKEVLTGPKKYVPIILLVCVALIAGVVMWWMLAGRWTTTPSLSGLALADAQAAVDGQGFTLEESDEYSETVPKGIIIHTDPADGDKVKRDGTITVYVSLGPERYVMPKVVGLTVDEAKQTLQDNNLTWGNITDGWSETIPVGSVLSASQDAGASLKKGTPIDLIVSKGREPLTIPNYTCDSGNSDCKAAADAKTALEGLGFVVVTSEDNSGTVPAGSIISQAPKDGTGYRGDTITLVVSKGPLMVEVPDVKTKDRNTAVTSLQGAGFVVKVTEVNPSWTVGIAARTDPAGGTMAPQGSTIILYLV